MQDEPSPRKTASHAVGQRLDDLSIVECDERIILLKDEIERIEVAKRQKQAAAAYAGSVFR